MLHTDNPELKLKFSISAIITLSAECWLLSSAKEEHKISYES